MRGAELLRQKPGLYKSPHGMMEISKDASYVNTAIITEGSGTIKVGNSVLEDCRILAEDGAKVAIGDDCILRGLVIVCNKDSEVIIGSKCTVHADFWGKTTIHSMNFASVAIGDDCMLSGNIVIRNNDGHDICRHGTNIPNNLSSDIIIENHVWICESVRILKGVYIRENSIVGCGSVVTSNNYPPNVKIAGNPAHIIGNLAEETWIHDAVRNKGEG